MTNTPPARDHARRIAAEISVRPAQVMAAIALFDDGNTIPFVARYRKEATQGLDEDQLRTIDDRVQTYRALDDRRATILKSIDEQGKLTDGLRAAIEAAETRAGLEDLYQPYKPRRRTRASMARERGLQPLADMILAQEPSRASVDALAQPFLSEQVPALQDALAGARDIVAETITDEPEVRRLVRDKAMRNAVLRSAKVDGAEDPRGVFALYHDFEASVRRLRPHQVLAMNRGERENVLRVSVDVAQHDWLPVIESRHPVSRLCPLAKQLALAAMDGAQRLLLPAIARDVRRSLTEAAERHAIDVFAANLRGLLTQPPLQGHTVLGIDPGFRTGCKVAVTDATGRVLDTGTIYPHEPQKRWTEASKSIRSAIQRHGVTIVAIGNGTASRETEALVAETIRDSNATVRYIVVDESGASVYSASPLARAEMPDLDVSLRGAVSIARRVQDPMSELVKIDPRSIGVGMYQHDVDQRALERALTGVVESVVNRVGVDVNTASPALLTHVAGIGPKVAANIVTHRDAEGTFSDRRSMLDVKGLGPKAFRQAAGFLRVRNGREPLDQGAIHPESYGVARKVLAMAGLRTDTPLTKREEALDLLQQTTPVAVLARELGVGEPTLQDILEQLVRPGRDPREDLPPPMLRQDVVSMDDLVVGMQLSGTVRNVVDFGAFVDIGVKSDGLVHRSRMPRGTRLTVGEVVKVEVVSVDADRGRIGLAIAAAANE